MTIKPADIQHNAYTENLGTDWVAIDHLGRPLSRAGDKESVQHAAPDAAAYFTGKDIKDPLDHDADGRKGGAHKPVEDTPPTRHLGPTEPETPPEQPKTKATDTGGTAENTTTEAPTSRQRKPS